MACEKPRSYYICVILARLIFKRMKADLQRKKQIYQRSIRNQQINEYFATRRLEARQT